MCAYVCVCILASVSPFALENVYKLVRRKSSRLCMLLQVFPCVFVCVRARARVCVCISMRKCLHKYECVQECLWKVVSMCVAVALMALGESQCVAVCFAVRVAVALVALGEIQCVPVCVTVCYSVCCSVCCISVCICVCMCARVCVCA